MFRHTLLLCMDRFCLAAKTGTEDLKGLIADDSRWGHIPGGEKLPVDKAPIIIEDDMINNYK